MAEFNVWVSHGESGSQVDLLTTEDGTKASQLVGVLVGVAGSQSFDVGVSIDSSKGGQQQPAPPVPPQPPAPPGPQQPTGPTQPTDPTPPAPQMAAQTGRRGGR